jgi:TIR domain
VALHGAKRTSKSKKTPGGGRAPKAEPYVVFISHSSRDSWIAGVLAEKVKAVGAKPWLDVMDLEGGDIVDQEILKGIDTCQEAIVLVSSYSVGSQWVILEIGATWGQHKRVTPVLNNVSHDAIAPLRFCKAIDLNDFDRFLSELRTRVRQE